MKTKNLIISLIQQDLKHNQLVIGLDNIGLQAGEKHHLELLNIVYDLMKVPQAVEMDWGMTYTNYMNKALRYKIRSTSKGLRHQAELCYTHLKCIVDIENEQSNKRTTK